MLKLKDNFAKSFVIRPTDPSEYGYICPHCQTRYGARQRLGLVDIARCEKCPSLFEAIELYKEKRKVERRDRYDRTKF